MELNEQQKYIVNLDKPYIAVVASAAAGKTRVLTERVRRMLKDGITPSDIAVITFTNMAAQELKERLADDYQAGMYIGTIHGLANRFLTYYGINTASLIKEEEFDKFFDLVKKNPDCVHHIKHILLDESQDTSPKEYDFLFNMINPDTYFIVGDLKQSIFGFRGADSKLFQKIISDPEVTVCSLNQNYRNASNILSFAKSILWRDRISDDSIAARSGGLVYTGLPNFDNVISWINEEGHFKDWAILCTTNSIIHENMELLKDAGIPCITFKQARMNKSELGDLIKKDAVKVLTFHSSKGLEFPNVIAWKPRWWGDQHIELNYVGATRAINRLYWLDEPKKKRK